MGNPRMKRAGMGKLESEINEFCCCPGLHAGLKLKTSRLSHSSTITSHFPFGFPFRVFSLHLLAPTGITFLSFAMFSYKDCLQFDFIWNLLVISHSFEIQSLNNIDEFIFTQAFIFIIRNEFKISFLLIYKMDQEKIGFEMEDWNSIINDLIFGL